MSEKEDFSKSDCAFCEVKTPKSIPLSRVLEKLDQHLFQKDFDGALRHLQYWEKDAEAIGDMRGKLSILNEFIGFYRKTGNQEKAIEASKEALDLAEELGLENTLTMGTTLINAATALKAFDRPSEALPLYEKAKVIYEENISEDDMRLAGLYNNMALALCQLKEYAKAEECFNKAIEISQKAEQDTQIAITYCNLADLVYEKNGEKLSNESKAQIEKYLDSAMESFRSCKLRNGVFAYACERCAEVFGFYGYDEYEKETKEYANSVYERT